ncbi:carboxymuconolactone decarboxylase family protein [Candidatus Binatia bacterium]|nr:carboxymuconolactone decarboxylase family protein [Candidatus Binatia bacterium]
MATSSNRDRPTGAQRSPEPGSRALDELLGLSPAAETLRAYDVALWRDPATDPLLLELCRLRLAQLLGLDPASRRPAPAAIAAGLDPARVSELARWPTSPLFGTRERAALAFAEQWFLDPSGMTDDDCAVLRGAIGEPGCAAFTMGLALSEAMLRLELVLAGTLARRS